MENMHTDIMVQNFKARRPRLAARFRLTQLVIFAIPGESGKLADVEIEKGHNLQTPPFSLHNVCLRGIILCDVPCGVKSSPMYLQTFHSSPTQHEPRRLSSLSLELLVEPENWPKESVTE